MPELDFLRDETLQSVNNNLAECNLYLESLARGQTFDITDIQTVKDISRDGLARKYFSEGDQIVVAYTDVSGNTYSMPWDMMLGRTATLADGTSREVIYLKSHFTTVEAIPFDAVEAEKATEETATAGLYYYGYDGTNYTLLSLSAGDPVPYSSYTAIYHNGVKDTTCNILKYGYNRYSHSAIHQWLNSTAEKGNWWTAQHVGDVAPSELNSYRGFLAGLPEEFVNAAETVQITRGLNTVSEPDKTLGTERITTKFFLPSLEQMYIEPQVSGVEGDYWAYYKELAEAAGLTGNFQRSTTYADLISYPLNNQSQAQNVRLSSMHRSSSCSTWYVSSSGGISTYYGRGAYRACPVCVI